MERKTSKEKNKLKTEMKTKTKNKGIKKVKAGRKCWKDFERVWINDFPPAQVRVI